MPEPMWRRIADDLREKIESGQLGRDGRPLPTELELREQYAASRNTVRDSVRWLINRGLVETRPGQGTFVVQQIVPFVTTLTGDPTTGRDDEGPVYIAEIQATRRHPSLTKPRVEAQEASGAIAEQLQIAEGTPVVSRHQRRYIDETPWSLQTSFYPQSLVERGATKLVDAANLDEGAVAYLTTAIGLHQIGYRNTITVRVPDPNETAFFRLPDAGRVAVYEVFRTAFDQDGEPFRLTVSVYPADRNQFTVVVGQVQEEINSSAGNPDPVR